MWKGVVSPPPSATRIPPRLETCGLIGRCSKCHKKKHAKIIEISKKFILYLLFDIDFIRIRRLAQFLQPIEIYQESGF